jgi:hypothetical protein
LFNPRKGWLHWRVLAPKIQRSRAGIPISLEEQGQGEFILSFPRWYRTRPEFVDEYVRFCDLWCPQAEAYTAFAALPFNECTEQFFEVEFVNKVRAMFKRALPQRHEDWITLMWGYRFDVPRDWRARFLFLATPGSMFPGNRESVNILGKGAGLRFSFSCHSFPFPSCESVIVVHHF